MAGGTDTNAVAASGQQAFVDLIGAVFATSSDAALAAFVKLRSFMKADARIERLYQSAQMGSLSQSEDDLFATTQRGVLQWDLTAIVRSVVLPLAGGYLGAGVAALLGATGAVPAIVGLLVGAIIWLCVAPGTWQMLKSRIGATVDGIFKPVSDL